jgi:predicted nucleic acid-binding protein
MNYLLDVNVLVAWGWADHTEHERAVRWIAEVRNKGIDILLTSPIAELGFVRVSVQRTQGQLRPSVAAEVLKGMIESLGDRCRFLPDDQSSTRFPESCVSATHTTDVHLMKLAESHSALLATLDLGIIGAFLIP